MTFNIKFQEGSKETNGINGLYVEEAIEQVMKRIEELDAKQSCIENSFALCHLRQSKLWLEERQKRRNGTK